MARRQLAVASPISIAAVGRAFIDAFLAEDALASNAQALVRTRYGAPSVVLTNSGTSALVLALRLSAGVDGVVGMPGYACVDLAAAARRAGVRVRLYDLDPVTLGPDLGSIEALMKRGASAIVVAHLYGYPADVPAVRVLATQYGAVVIEDAAQGAGGALLGKRLGSFGDLGVLSFGRGKGLCAGGGGALLGFGDRWEKAVDAVALPSGGRGLPGVAKSVVQWALGRPALYGIPSMLPWLHLGEMVFHEATEPRGMSLAACSMLPSALALETIELSTRRTHARQLDRVAATSSTVGMSIAIADAVPGYLRYAVRDLAGGRAAVPSLGILQPYPQTLAEQPELQPVLISGEPPTRGATELRRALYTLPTHGFVREADLAALAEWLEGRKP